MRNEQGSVSYTHLRAHETSLHLVCRLLLEKNFFLILRRPPGSTHCISSAASDVYKRQETDILSALRNGKEIAPLIQQSILKKHAKRAGIESFESEEGKEIFSQNRSMTTIGG